MNSWPNMFICVHKILHCGLKELICTHKTILWPKNFFIFAPKYNTVVKYVNLSTQNTTMCSRNINLNTQNNTMEQKNVILCVQNTAIRQKMFCPCIWPWTTPLAPYLLSQIGEAEKNIDWCAQNTTLWPKIIIWVNKIRHWGQKMLNCPNEVLNCGQKC